MLTAPTRARALPAGALLAGAVLIGSVAAAAENQDAINACIDQLRATGTPDAQSGGEVLSSEFSQAGTLVMLRDAGGSVWRCIAYSDGTVGELSVADAADDGAGALAGASAEAAGGTETRRVAFDSGTTGAELVDRLAPGASIRYVLGARNGQSLYVRVAPDGPGVSYQIFNPDGTFLLEAMDPAREYRGELWQAGDHVVEVFNRSNTAVGYAVIMGID